MLASSLLCCEIFCVLQILAVESAWSEPQSMALLSCRIVDPSVTSGPRYHAAVKGELGLTAAASLSKFC